MAEQIEILLVEDNASDAELTLHALRRSGLTPSIETVGDGAEAMDFLFRRGAYAGREGALPKLVLLDLKMPKVGGLEVLQQVKADPCTRAIPMVVLTSSREDSDIAKSYQLGANSYIVKPVDFMKFNEMVRQIGLYWLQLNQPVQFL
jgi:CheY-like chemotaxis protein